MLEEVLGSRLLFVSGKGGVGKTSFAAAVAKTSAHFSKRVLLVEIDNFYPSLTAVFSTAPGYQPKMVEKNLAICNITWERALEDWLLQTIKIRRVVNMIQKNKIAMLFLDATPGAREIVILSKVVSLLDSWDQVIVDLPASGHALGVLRVPVTAKKLMRSGPIHDRASQVLKVLSQKSTKLAIVSLPEEMVVNETIEFMQKVAKGLPFMEKPDVVLNRASKPSLTPDELLLLERLEAEEDVMGAEARELLQAGRWERDLESATGIGLKRLKEACGEEIFSFTRLGNLGGYKGGPNQVVQQMYTEILRKVKNAK
ncbi:MAG: ArsA-related P-loop ATPase [Myxococcota bacterium]|nr:ArsA-related P-loop ATPase [Myxococcota bacterium]